jgi:hypothetical protein
LADDDATVFEHETDDVSVVSGRLKVKDDDGGLIGRKIRLDGVIDDIQQLVATEETAATFELVRRPIYSHTAEGARSTPRGLPEPCID